MADKEITITGNNYNLTARELPNGGWHVFGDFDEFDIDNLWNDIQLDTFEDVDDMILALVSDDEI